MHQHPGEVLPPNFDFVVELGFGPDELPDVLAPHVALDVPLVPIAIPVLNLRAKLGFEVMAGVPALDEEIHQVVVGVKLEVADLLVQLGPDFELHQLRADFDDQAVDQGVGGEHLPQWFSGIYLFLADDGLVGNGIVLVLDGPVDEELISQANSSSRKENCSSISSWRSSIDLSRVTSILMSSKMSLSSYRLAAGLEGCRGICFF